MNITKMYSKSLSLQLIRTLRTLRSRTVQQIAKSVTPSSDILQSHLPSAESEDVAPVLPLSEDDLQRLNKGMKDEISMVDNTHSSILSVNDIGELISDNLPKKPVKKKLMDYKLEVPLQEAITEENQFEKLNTVVTPLSKKPYHVQLYLKQDHARSVLLSLKKELRQYKVPMCPSVNKLPCPLEKIYPSPEIVAYRNKDEFSVHIGVDGNPKTVGYFVSYPKDPLMRCVNPTHLINIRDSHKLVAQHFQEFIRSSPHKTCLNFSEGGVWKHIVVRSTLTDERMLSVNVFSKGLPDGGKEEVKEDLEKYFFHGAGAECQLSSLYLQACPHARCTRETAPYELVAGKEYITEECLGRKFQISPDSFFQTNTKVAEILYETVRKVSEVSSLTTVLDICCGTGTISNLFAPHIRGAIGIDVVTGAIEDAKMNAAANNIRNVNFIPGTVEKMLPILSEDLNDCTEVLAVVNPARAGLSPSIIETIRNCSSIKKLVYICCKPEGNAATNMALLGTSLPWKKFLSKRRLVDPGEPFVPTYCVPIDMFPQTLHTEYVILFERIEYHDKW